MFSRKQIVFVLAQKFGTKQSNLIWSGNCLGQNRTFLFNPKTYRSKQNVLIWSTYYQYKRKTFGFGPLIVGRKKKSWFGLLLCFFCAVADLTSRRFCYDKARVFKFAELAGQVYTKTHWKFGSKRILHFWCSFEVDANMYIQVFFVQSPT